MKRTRKPDNLLSGFFVYIGSKFAFETLILPLNKNQNTMMQKGFLKDQNNYNSKSDGLVDKISSAVKIIGMIALAGSLIYMVFKLSKNDQMINKWYLIAFAVVIFLLAGLVLKLTQKRKK